MLEDLPKTQRQVIIRLASYFKLWLFGLHPALVIAEDALALAVPCLNSLHTKATWLSSPDPYLAKSRLPSSMLIMALLLWRQRTDQDPRALVVQAELPPHTRAVSLVSFCKFLMLLESSGPVQVWVAAVSL